MKAEVIRVLKYLFSSLSAFVIDICIFHLMVLLLKGHSGYYIFISTFISRVISSIYSFTINKKLVFKNKGRTWDSFIKFVILCVIQMCLSATLVNGIYRLIKVNESLIKICVDSVLFVFSYLAQRYVVFIAKDG